MSVMDDTLAHAETALTASLQGEPAARLGAMTRFMECFERLARDVARGGADWDKARPWAMRNSERLRAAREALSDWDLETGQIFYGGTEESAERALQRRSQFAFVRELFRDTAAEEMLLGYEAHDVDQDFREQAERLGLDAPDWVPRSHSWWSWHE